MQVYLFFFCLPVNFMCVIFSSLFFLHKYIICSMYSNEKVSSRKKMWSHRISIFLSFSLTLTLSKYITFDFILYVYNILLPISFEILKWITSICNFSLPPSFVFCLCLCLWVCVWPKCIFLNYNWNNSSCCSCSLRSELFTRFPCFTTICVPLPVLLPMPPPPL